MRCAEDVAPYNNATKLCRVLLPRLSGEVVRSAGEGIEMI